MRGMRQQHQQQQQQYEEEETVYNLVKHEEPPQAKPPLYRSRFNGAPPKFEKAAKEHLGGGVGEARTMGKLVNKPSPDKFIKKFARTAPLPPTTEVAKFERAPITEKKPSVPARTEKPVMGLVSQKNYITANAVDAILAVPSRPNHRDTISYLHKADYGRVPAYIPRIKSQIQEEYKLIAELQQQQRQEDDGLELLRDDERDAIVEGLKANWERINKEYQTLSFTLDTPAKRKRKEEYEAMLEQIEQDIKKLTRKFVFVNSSE